ncbi:MAG TPA: ATP-binding protein [Tepidisphaeraceae bacterium]|jgi:predicted kinase
MNAIVLCGIQASGKTSFYREHFFHTHIRLSLDQLGTRNKENIILHACLAAQQPFVIDNTNLLATARMRYAHLAKESGFRTTLYFFETPTRDAIARNAKRGKDEQVPKLAILGSQKKLQPPTADEGFDDAFRVRLTADGFAIEPFTA